MSNRNAVPSFGGRLKEASYYQEVGAIIASLRPNATLRCIADRLNECGYTTPRDYAWDRMKVAAYLRSHHA